MSSDSTKPQATALIEQDAGCRITRWTREAEQLFGWSEADMVGQRSHVLVPERNRARHDADLSQILMFADNRVHDKEITAVHRDGREFRIQATMNRMRTAFGDRLIARVFALDAQHTLDQARYRMILDQIEDGCSVTDLHGRYVYVNDAFCRIFGLHRDEVMGQRFTRSTEEKRANLMFSVYNQVYRTGEPVRAFEYEVEVAGVPSLFIEQSVSLERDASGAPIGFLAISRDCTARKQAEQAIEKARVEAERARVAAEEASRAKSEFLANMSHEIRTPMNGIIGMTVLTLDTELTPYQADCLSTVRSSAESLLTILNDILDFSKIESRKLALEAIPFSLSALVNDALKPLGARAAQKGLEFSIALAADVPERVIGDPVRLRQILTNLTGNAVKFTERGRVGIEVRLDRTCAAHPDDRVRLHVTIADTGIGIAESQLDTIFDPFTQADGSTTRRFGGTGLGLAISSTLVTMMDGCVWVDSRLGEGSTFHFTAGFGRVSASVTPVARDRGSDHAPHAARPLRILVAEDNPVNQRVARGLLSKRGHTVTIVGNGQEAVDALAGGAFDLVLMDVQMPVMGGVEATAAIRDRERSTGKHQRIVAMTAHAMTGDRERYLQAGMDGYISKPLDVQTLVTVVEREDEPDAEGSMPVAAAS
jgi:PAS domain S-box-containing protein